MPDPDVRRERRALIAFAAAAAALLLIGVVAAMMLTAGEPRRGEGMIPGPETSTTGPEAPDASPGTDASSP